MEQIIKIGKLAKLLDVTVSTLRRWDNDGTLKAHRTASGRRYYLESEVTLWQKGYPFQEQYQNKGAELKTAEQY